MVNDTYWNFDEPNCKHRYPYAKHCTALLAEKNADNMYLIITVYNAEI
jgi:hypothetical protein